MSQDPVERAANSRSWSAAQVDDVYRLVLQDDASILAGKRWLNRSVGWVTTLRGLPPIFESSGGDEVVIAPTATLESLDALGREYRLDEIVSNLSQTDVAAVVVLSVGPWHCPEDAIKTANVNGLPLLHVSTNRTAAELERAIASLVVDRQAELNQRATEIYRNLAAISVEGQGIDQILEVAAALTGHTVFVEDANYHIQAAAPASANLPSPYSSIADRQRLETALGTGVSTSTTPPVLLLERGRRGWDRFTGAVLSRGKLRSFVSLCATSLELTDLDELVAGRLAAVLTLEFAKQDAVRLAARQDREVLFDQLLAEASAPSVDLERQLHRLGFRTDTAIASITVIRDDGEEPTPRNVDVDKRYSEILEAVRQALTRRNQPALTRLYDDNIVVLLGLQADPSGQGIRSIERVRLILDDVHTAVETSRCGSITSGASAIYPRLADTAAAIEESGKAAKLVSIVYGPGQKAALSDLGLYRLLYQLRTNNEVEVFYNQTLGALAAYDKRTGGDLINTLEAYFSCRTNLSEAARRLNLHRNSLLYRVRRIEEVGQVDIQDPEALLALQVALKVRHLLDI